MTRRPPGPARTLIAELRTLYPGLLTYSANWDEAQDVLFWDQLDLIGINAFYPLADHDNATFDEYDVIACLGLFYHLTIDDQLDLLARCSGTPMILDTHVANNRKTPAKLSKPVTLHGYTGRYYGEFDQTKPTAAWGNEYSFWPRTRALMRMLDAHGYDVLTAYPWYLPTRTFWLCLPR